MTSNTNKEDEGDKSFIWTTVIVGLLIVGLWTITYLMLRNDDDRGVFGDMFGSVNSLFSGLALAGIILTILLQRKELKLQRQELRDTRKEFVMQNETLRLQRFENTFFNLLNQHHQIVNAIDFRYYKTKEKDPGIQLQRRIALAERPPEDKEIVVIQGRDVFRFRYSTLRRDLTRKPETLNEVYLKHYHDAQADFGHYFRNIYRIIKLVDQTIFFDEANETNEDTIFNTKYKYTSILRAQISDYELLWIFYNCLSENGRDKFKPLIERYSFFKNLPRQELAIKEHFDLYKKEAYGRQ